MKDMWTRTLPLLPAATMVLMFACARRNSDSDALHRIDSPPGQSADAHLVGNWLLRADPPLPPDGLRITVTIDSAKSSNVFGRISHYFSGNVGTDPREYRPFVGVLKARGGVEFTIDKTDPTLPGLSVVGQFAADTLRCQRLLLGPDTLTGGNREWLFVKENR